MMSGDRAAGGCHLSNKKLDSVTERLGREKIWSSVGFNNENKAPAVVEKS